jgi:hypothetical protein
LETTVALLLVLAAPFAAAQTAAQGNTEGVGDILWPSEDHRRFTALADLGTSLLEDGIDPVRLGIAPLESLHFEQKNASTTKVIVEEKGRSAVSFVQPHSPTDIDGHTTLRVSPSDLPATVEGQLDPSRTSNYVLTVTGPAGSFALDGDSAEEKVASLAETIGFPLEEMNRDLPPQSFPRLYSGERGCYDSTEGGCNVSATLSVHCSSCSVLMFTGPSGDSDFDQGGVGLALFDDEERLLAATVSFAFDLDESAVTEPEIARDEAADRLRDRGYQVDGKPSVDDVMVRTVLADREVAVEEVRYGWRFAVSENSSASEGGNGSAEPVPPGGRIAEIQQDAATGDLASLKIDPADVSEDTDANDSRENTTRPPNERNESTDPAPAPGLAVVGAILGALAAVLARPRS